MSTTEKEVASLEALIGANEVKFDTVDAYGVRVRIGSLSSADMIDWLDMMDVPAKKRLTGIRLIIKSLVDKDGKRLATEDPEVFDKLVATFASKDASENAKVIRAVRRLNGLDKPEETLAALKNDSGEASTGASPTDSASK